jgi:hypothetical protein
LLLVVFKAVFKAMVNNGLWHKILHTSVFLHH